MNRNRKGIATTQIIKQWVYTQQYRYGAFFNKKEVFINKKVKFINQYCYTSAKM